MRLIIVRHFKTLNNLARRIMGWGDAPPADDWEEDLLDVDRVLSTRGIRFDGIYSSALGRSRETARYFAASRGRLQVRSSARLNEVNYGDLFQAPKHWVAEHYPEYKTDPDYVFPGGESFRAMQKRSLDYLLSLEARHSADTLLLVLHAGVIRGLVTHFLALPYAPNLRRKVSHRYIGDFTISQSVCVRYDEIGRPSGFVKDGVLAIPWAPGQVVPASRRLQDPPAVPREAPRTSR